MELVLFSLLACFIFTCIQLLKSHQKSSKLPPGPYPVPIIGNILQIRKRGLLPHLVFAKLSEKYGPLVYLKLGSTDLILVSSAETSKEILHRHEHAVSMRPPMAVSQALKLKTLGLAWMPPDELWREHRKILKEQMFSNSQLEANKVIRQKKVEKLIEHVQERCFSGRAVDINEAAFVTMLNLMWDALFSLDCADFENNSSRELREIVNGVLKSWGAPNVADYFPILKALDPQGIKQDTERFIGKLFEIFEGIIDQRLRLGHRYDDVLGKLLEINKRNQTQLLTRDQINYLLLDLILGVTDTMSTTIAWAMAELLRNPEKLTRAKEELNALNTAKNELIKESDTSGLIYLQAIIKETIRLHNPGPLFPRYNREHAFEVNGYKIPKNATIMVNSWAISRDPSTWSNPDSFEPERFIEHDIDIVGQDFRFIPFGSGRRICPGMPLAQRMLQLTMANLIHGFDWKLEQGLEPKDIDMSERYGMTLMKAVPLKLIPVKI